MGFSLDYCSLNMDISGNNNIHEEIIIDILYTLDSASLLVKLKPRIFQRLPPFE